MHKYFRKDSHSARRKNDLVVNRAKTATFGEKKLRTLGPKMWISLPEHVKDFLSVFYKSTYNMDLNVNGTSANTRLVHITILELYTLASICPSGNLIQAKYQT